MSEVRRSRARVASAVNLVIAAAYQSGTIKFVARCPSEEAPHWTVAGRRFVPSVLRGKQLVLFASAETASQSAAFSALHCNKALLFGIRISRRSMTSRLDFVLAPVGIRVDEKTQAMVVAAVICRDRCSWKRKKPGRCVAVGPRNTTMLSMFGDFSMAHHAWPFTRLPPTALIAILFGARAHHNKSSMAQ